MMSFWRLVLIPTLFRAYYFSTLRMGSMFNVADKEIWFLKICAFSCLVPCHCFWHVKRRALEVSFVWFNSVLTLLVFYNSICKRLDGIDVSFCIFSWNSNKYCLKCAVEVCVSFLGSPWIFARWRCCCKPLPGGLDSYACVPMRTVSHPKVSHHERGKHTQYL